MIFTHPRAIHSDGCCIVKQQQQQQEEINENENTKLSNIKNTNEAIDTIKCCFLHFKQHQQHRVRRKCPLTSDRILPNSSSLFWVFYALLFILLIHQTECSLLPSLARAATLTSNAPFAGDLIVDDRNNGTLDSTLVNSTTTTTVVSTSTVLLERVNNNNSNLNHTSQYSHSNSNFNVQSSKSLSENYPTASSNLNYNAPSHPSNYINSNYKETPDLEKARAERFTQEERPLEAQQQKEHPHSDSHSIIYSNKTTHDSNNTTTSLINGHVLSATYTNNPQNYISNSGEESGGDLYTQPLTRSNLSDALSGGAGFNFTSSNSFDLDLNSSEENSTSVNTTTSKSFTMDWFNLDIDFDSVASFLASGAIIFGGLLPYVPQYWEIYKTKNSSGFSTYVCLNLIAANTLRIIFWFGKHFEIPLLVQSIVMLIMMFIMMEICLRMRNRASSSSSTPSKSKSFFDLNPRHFWQWSDLMSYIECTVIFAVIVGVLMYFLVSCTLFVEFIGYASLLTEALLAVPQLIKNYNSKSTIGMSQIMVLLWALGDLFKTGYFIVKNVPVQFVVCGVIQVTVDLMILAQVSLYSRRSDESHYRT